MSGIFSTTAPAYFAAGIPVIPLKKETKRPLPTNWSNFASKPIPESLHKEWLISASDGNIGLVLGPLSGVCVVDIDSEDDRVIDLIKSILPPSPWVRVGKKGCVMAFKFTENRTFRVHTKEHGSICELLSEGTQVVLPPSIHPDTKKPYVANCELLSVIDKLNPLPLDFEEQLRAALTHAGFDLTAAGFGKMTDYIAAGFRDSSLTQRAGVIAYDIRRGTISLKEGIEVLYSINADFTQEVVGDAMDMDKHINNLVGFLKRDLANENMVLAKGWDEGLSQEELAQLGFDDMSEKTEMSYQEIAAEFSKSLDDMEDPIRCVEKAVSRMAQITEPKMMEEKAFIRTMVSQAKAGLTSADILADLKSHRDRIRTDQFGEYKDLDSHSEVALAALHKIAIYNPVACDETNLMYQYMGSHWVEMHQDAIKLFISKNFKGVEIVRRNSDIKGIAELVHIHASKGLKKHNIEGVNFANGYLTSEGVLMPHDRDFGCTYVLPYQYRKELAGKMPLFNKFLETSWGHTPDYGHRCKALQQALCATLMGTATRFQRAFLLYGVARSGKSVLLEIIGNLLPSDAKSALSPQQWKDNFQVVGLNHKLINIVGELSERHNIDGHTFKEVIDGSAMSVRRLYGEPFIMNCNAAHWAASNHFPRTTDSSEGFNRRWLVFHFDRAVPMDQVKINLAKQIIATEREAIVAWALEAIQEMKQISSYVLPDSHVEIVNQISCYNNPVRYFLQECRQISPPESQSRKNGTATAMDIVKEGNLYMEFLRFCNQFTPMRGRNALDARDFRSKMDELTHEFNFTRQLDTYRGIKILEELG